MYQGIRGSFYSRAGRLGRRGLPFNRFQRADRYWQVRRWRLEQLRDYLARWLEAVDDQLDAMDEAEERSRTIESTEEAKPSGGRQDVELRESSEDKGGQAEELKPGSGRRGSEPKRKPEDGAPA
jgi:hypothetical protein